MSISLDEKMDDGEFMVGEDDGPLWVLLAMTATDIARDHYAPLVDFVRKVEKEGLVGLRMEAAKVLELLGEK